MVEKTSYKIIFKGGPRNGLFMQKPEVPRTLNVPDHTGAYHRKAVDEDVKVGVMEWKEVTNG